MWRSLTRYHPRIGYTYIPGLKARVPFENGAYMIRVNGSGFRSEHEFSLERPPSRRRILVFGDSQTAGDGVSNGKRYTDHLESMLEDVEIFNFGLPATGTDQQYLAYQDFAATMDHDLLVLGVHVENIGRIASRFRPYVDEEENEVIYSKPYFRLDGGRLVLEGVPVEKRPRPLEELSLQEQNHVDHGVPLHLLRKMVKALGLRDLAQQLTKFQPVPAYNEPTDPKWLLMRAILSEWIRASRAPALIVPIPLFCFTEETADPAPYQARFAELAAETGAMLHDPLPDLRKYPMDTRRGFRFQRDIHFTPAGHRAVAESLYPPIRKALTELGVEN